MKIRLRNILALVMAAVMMLSAFSFASYAAAPDEFDNIQTITTGSFNVTILDSSNTMYYKFIPSQTGYYYLSAGDVDSVSFTFYDSGFVEIGYAYIGNWNDNSSSFLYFTAGSTYYTEVAAYSEVFPFTFTANLCYLGTLDKAEITRLPYKLTYIQGYETNWPSDPEIAGCYDRLDLEGFELYLAFSGGSVFRLYGYEISQQLNFLNPDAQIGMHTITITVMGQYIASFDIEVIENPVSSIEVVQTPYKDYYRYARDGDFYLDGWFHGRFYPYLELEGLKVKINYTDGTSKIAELNEYDWDGEYIDHYYMSAYCDECDVGDNEVSVGYLMHTATFTIRVVDISLFEKLYVYVREYMKIIADALHPFF